MQPTLFGDMRAIDVDLFAGGGGASVGMEAATGHHVDIAINHDPVAIAVHKLNHPCTRHFTSDIWSVDPADACGGAPIDRLWASPDCTHHSRAKAGQPRKQGIRDLAWVVVRWAEAKRPRLIFLENVAEFEGWGPLDVDGLPDKAQSGETFRLWVAKLRALGYAVQWRVLNAAEYGAPTARHRLFVIARCDGQPIRWPKPTHGPGLKPFRTAAECIDMTIPCPSIFLTKEEAKAIGVKRPLADKTMARIAAGVYRFVINDPNPFIIHLTHGGKRRAHAVDEPLPTVTGANRGEMALCAPYFIPRHGEAPGQAPRCRSVDAPMPTVTGTANGAVMCAAFLAKHFGGMVGQPLTQTMPTVTARDHSALGVAMLTKFYGTNRVGASLNDPMPTATGGAGGGHLGLVAGSLAHTGDAAAADRRATVSAFLMKYCQSLLTPMHTVVVVHGEEYQIVDIGMRMLRPHELLAAQFGEFAPGYLFDATNPKTGRPITATDMTKLIGNSVCPEVARAIVEANPIDAPVEVAA